MKARAQRVFVASRSARLCWRLLLPMLFLSLLPACRRPHTHIRVYCDDDSRVLCEALAQELARTQPQLQYEWYFRPADMLLQRLKLGDSPQVLITAAGPWLPAFGLQNQWLQRMLLVEDRAVLAVPVGFAARLDSLRLGHTACIAVPPHGSRLAQCADSLLHRLPAGHGPNACRIPTLSLRQPLQYVQARSTPAAVLAQSEAIRQNWPLLLRYTPSTQLAIELYTPSGQDSSRVLPLLRYLAAEDTRNRMLNLGYF